MAKRERFTTETGDAVYPWLNKPDTKAFKGQEAKPAFKVTLRLEGAAADKLKEIINPVVDAAYDEQVEVFKTRIEESKGKALKDARAGLEDMVKKYPYEEDVDDDGEGNGKWLFKFKQNARIKTKQGYMDITIPLFDGQGNKMAENIYGGSRIKVNFSMRGYYMESAGEAGTTLDINAIQVIELVSSNAGNADDYGFGAEEGAFETDPSSSFEHGTNSGGEAGEGSDEEQF
jgi:hypothetical protein